MLYILRVVVRWEPVLKSTGLGVLGNSHTISDTSLLAVCCQLKCQGWCCEGGGELSRRLVMVDFALDGMQGMYSTSQPGLQTAQ